MAKRFTGLIFPEHDPKVRAADQENVQNYKYIKNTSKIQIKSTQQSPDQNYKVQATLVTEPWRSLALKHLGLTQTHGKVLDSLKACPVSTIAVEMDIEPQH